MPLKFDSKSGMFKPARRGGSKKRHFTAGESAAFLGWDSETVSLDSAIYSNLNRMKGRCRDLARNNDYIRHALRLMQSNVIGPDGFTFQSKLKTGDKPDRAFNKRLEQGWKNAGKLKNAPTACGKLSRADMGKLWLRTLAIDGEVILLLKPGHRGNKYRHAVSFIDTARLDWQLNKSLPNGHEIRMGVEVDQDARPVAYHFLNHDPTEYMWTQPAGRGMHTRISAERVLHDFLPEMPGQTRGVPLIASPAVRVHMLQRFEEAVVVAARVSASKVGFYKTDEDYSGIAPGDEDDDYQVAQTIDPGTFEQLPRGMSLETFDPSTPPANMDMFNKTMLKGICSGLGVDYVSTANDLEGVNYSSIRAGSLEQRSIYRGLQRFYVEHCEERIFEDWLKIQRVNPEFPIDGRKLDRLQMDEAWRFIGRGWAWVDPLKEVKAHKEAIGAGLTSRRRVVAELHGEDLEELDEEIKADAERAESMGLDFSEASPAPSPPAPGQPAEGEEIEED